MSDRTTQTPPAACLRPALCLLAAGLLAACGTPKASYPGAEAQQLAQRSAQADALPAGAVADPQATHRRLIEQMQREGLWYASLAHIDQFEQRAGPTPATTRLRADALRHTGQAEASRQAYARLAGTPEAAAGLHGLGLLAGAEGAFDRAAELLAQAQRQQPTDALLLNDLGYARLRAGRIAEARVPLMQAAQLQPDNPRIQLNLAAWLTADGQQDEAARLLDARRMAAGSREAVQATARLAREAAAVHAARPAAAAAAAAPDGLSLRPAGWREARRIHVGVRRVEMAQGGQVPAAPGSTAEPGQP
ncbi:hypothetical protein [Xenophilus azovorans]|uniref:hypothetical protein n=1 Tax=Xenophilus azovorans TaxID=151755 RepID=UPI000A00950C|nr:hypothetical protein [Xenophilus azovorans]